MKIPFAAHCWTDIINIIVDLEDKEQNGKATQGKKLNYPSLNNGVKMCIIPFPPYRLSK